MPLLKSLIGLVYEEDVPQPATAPQAATASAPVISNQPAPAPAAPPAAEVQALDQKLQKLLLDALYGTPGIEAYKAFDDMLDSLADVVPDMNVRYKKATEILAKQGHTLPIILTGIDKAIGALEDSAREFEATQKRQFQNSVGALHKAVEQADQMIAAKQQQMEALKQEINALTQKRTADAAQISTEQAQIDHVQSRYSVVYQRISNEVLEQRTAVDQRMKAQ